jgi:hypothetical protein
MSHETSDLSHLELKPFLLTSLPIAKLKHTAAYLLKSSRNDLEVHLNEIRAGLCTVGEFYFLHS